MGNKMNCFRVALVSIVLLASVAFAQAPDTLWTRKAGSCNSDNSKDLLVDSSGALFLIGESDGRVGGNADYLLLIDSLSHPNAELHFFGRTESGFHDYSRRVLPRHNSGLSLFGQVFRFAGGHTKFGLTAVSTIGDSLFSRIYGGAEGAHDYLYDVIPTDFGYLMAGSKLARLRLMR